MVWICGWKVCPYEKIRLIDSYPGDLTGLILGSGVAPLRLCHSA